MGGWRQRCASAARGVPAWQGLREPRSDRSPGEARGSSREYSAARSAHPQPPGRAGTGTTSGTRGRSGPEGHGQGGHYPRRRGEAPDWGRRCGNSAPPALTLSRPASGSAPLSHVTPLSANRAVCLPPSFGCLVTAVHGARASLAPRCPGCRGLWTRPPGPRRSMGGAKARDWSPRKALLLTEVLKERDAQIEFKKTKPDIYKKKEEEMEREREKAILKEQEKAYERYMNRQALCRDHLEQIKEHKHQAELDKLEAKKEGEEIQRLTKLYELEVQRENEKKLEEKLEHRRMHCAHVADQDILKAVQEQKQEEENDKIRAHFKAKQNMAKLRREKEAEMNRLMQERRDIITNHLAAQMKQTFERIDERVARDVAEREAEWEKELKEREEKTKAELKSIAEHRATVIKMKGEREKEAILEGKEKLRELMEADRIYLEMEKDKKRRNRNENIKMQKTQIQQMAEKRAKEQHEKQAELDYEAQKEVITICKEQEFQEYANQVIDSESKTTRNIYPLLKAAKEGHGGGHGPVYRERGGIRPSYQARDINGTQLPSYNCNTTEEIKELNTNGNIQQAKGRLGFTW
ncbi:cilia- and flagella- associated protein 210 isoform X2 [Chrysemys picta bellii]|uniref:cilia- and flagella- associated protein 210 isoform X2 n=1 Tax=Chrysemys picta bellii TaxID=8478 RepID=UPI0032B274D4